jgi:hypothetical protein
MVQCYNCFDLNAEQTFKEHRNDKEFYPDVDFIDIIVYCKACGYTTNCVSTKKINNS